MWTNSSASDHYVELQLYTLNRQNESDVRVKMVSVKQNNNIGRLLG